MLTIQTATLPVVYITAIKGTKQTIVVVYQLELLYVDFWKHASFPAHLRPNWHHHHTSERDSPSPPPLWISVWKACNRMRGHTYTSVTVVLLDSISIDSMKKVWHSTWVVFHLLYNTLMYTELYCFWKHPCSLSIWFKSLPVTQSLLHIRRY